MNKLNQPSQPKSLNDDDEKKELDGEKVAYQLRDTPPRSKQALDAYLRYFYKMYLASVPIDDGNSCPLDFVWHIYSLAMGIKENPTMDDWNILGMSARGSQKSLSCAASELLLITFDKYRDYFHMAAIWEQSRVTYRYVQTCLDDPMLKPIVKKTIMRETISLYDRILKIGTGTIKAVNSFHGSIFADECDLTDHNVFVESKGMLSSAMGGRSPLDVKISSRKFAFGNIQSLLDKKDKDKSFPLTTFKWGQLEVTQRCETERSQGEEKNTTIFLDEENLRAISEKEYYEIKDIPEREKYLKTSGYPGCLPCGIFSFCKGNLKKQATDNPYLEPIDDVRRKFFTDEIEFFKSQRLNRKPSQFGLIYPTWNPFKQVHNYEGLFKIFTGKDWESDDELTLDKLFSIFIENGCKAYIGVDFGFHVAVAILGVRDGSDRLYFLDQVVSEGRSDSDFAKMVWDRWKHFKITRGFGDVASPGGIREFAKYFPMLEGNLVGTSEDVYREYAKISKNYDFRFGLVRKKISVSGSNETYLYCYSGVSEVVDYIGFYRFKLDPRTGMPTTVPKDGQRDHGCDASCYIVCGVEVAADVGVRSAFVTTQEEVRVKPTGAPTPEELADYLKVNINNNAHIMPSLSVAIDPFTGKPLKEADPKEKDPQPRGNKKFRFTITD